MSLLTLENIHKEYRNNKVLNGVSLRVERGERLSLIGPNGAGKTTLIRIALGMEKCDEGNVILTNNIKVGYISQGIMDVSEGIQLEDKKAFYHDKTRCLEIRMRELEKQMALGLDQYSQEEYAKLMKSYSRLVQEYEAMDGYIIEARIKATLLGLGLPEEALDIPLSSLSGGEKMRVSIARLLLEEPDLLILDEPTNHLDIHATEWLEGFLKKFDGGALIISHDRFFLDQVSTRIAELENGVITERSGSYTSFMEQKDLMREFASREQFRLRQEIKSQNLLIQEFKSKGKVKAFKSRTKVKERLQNELEQKVGSFKEEHHLKNRNNLRLSFGAAKHVSAEIAKAEGLQKSFGDKVLFDDMSFLIRGRESVGIIGSNGSGKTTLLNILTGKDVDYQGVAKLGEWVRYAFLGQEISFNSQENTIREEVLSRVEMAEPELLKYLSGYQFYGDDLNKRLEVLSGGERVRLYFACMMLKEQDCFIMDEPTNHLDVDARTSLENALKRFNGTVIAVSHDRYFLTHCVNRILEISGGKIVSYNGNYLAYKQMKMLKAVEKTDNNENSKLKPKGSKKDASDDNIHQPDRIQIENSIFEIEHKMRGLEASFGQSTPHEKYTEYTLLQNEAERLYALWEGLEDEVGK
ncbi:MAG: transporter [Clostridia bacterium]|jgi:ATP-binding cassette subfamily F protein 3|nr:transporter [Clostridia bacterium]